MHAQQMPMAPHPGMPALGALGSFAGPMGIPHASQAAMLKVPQDLHREDMKIPMGGASVEERLVGFSFCSQFCPFIRKPIKATNLCLRFFFICAAQFSLASRTK